MLQNKKTLPFIALLLSLGGYVEPTRAIDNQELIVAQKKNETTFPLVDSVAEGSVVKISGSQNIEPINNQLKEKFEDKYSGTTVEVTSTDSDTALKAVANQEVDLAAISRPLTEAEEAQGFKPVVINREKIAVIVGENNPYDGNLSTEQFTKVFRGEITNWSELGGASQPIKIIDRVSSNDTRRSFPSYSVFQNAEFKTGANAIVLPDNTTETIAEQLGTDGISYAPVSLVKDLQGIKVVVMHQTLPDDARYPFSQPNLYVYQGEPSEAVKGFLGFATAPVGQEIIQDTIASAIPVVKTPNSAVNSTTEVSPAITPTDSVDTALTTLNSATEVVPVNANSSSENWFWFLLPLALLIPLLAFLVKKGNSAQQETAETRISDRELVGAGVSRSPAYDNDDNEIAAETMIATGLGATAIANNPTKSNLPETFNLDNSVDEENNLVAEINPNLNITVSEVDGAVEVLDYKVSNINANLNTSELPNLGSSIDGVSKSPEISSHLNTPNLHQVDGAIEGVFNKFDRVNPNLNTFATPNIESGVENTIANSETTESFDQVNERLYPDTQSLQSTDLLGTIKDKAKEVNDLTDETLEIRDNLTGERKPSE